MSHMKTVLIPAKTKAAQPGWVERWLAAAPQESAKTADSSERLIQAIHSGFAFAELEQLREALDLPMDQLAVTLGLSRATLHRRKLTGRLDANESDRVLRFARLLGRALQVTGDLPSAREWLNSSQFGLGGAKPLEYAGTEVGAREVEDLLGRIEYGVYS